MVNTGKLAVISVLAILGLGSLGGGWYVGDFVGNALDEGIEDSLVLDPNYIIDDREGYDDWITNEDDDDPPKFKKYYFWNLTNPDAYLTGSNPVYEEIGPYAYRQYDVKINVQITATTVKYQTYTYYEFDTAASFDGASVDDRIVNVNPAYLGVIAGAGSEAALVTGFVGPTIASILGGLQGDFTDGVKVKGSAGGVASIMDGLTTTFPEKVLVGAIPTALLSVQAGVTENFHKVVNATTATVLLKANWETAQALNGSDQANADFFNSTKFFANYSSALGGSALQGLGDFTGGNLGYSNATATKLLFTGPGVGGIPGWTVDTLQGTGILGYLLLYDNATKGLGGMSNATLQGLYGASQLQLDAAANYLATYLINSNAVVEGAYQVANPGETTLEAAESMFYAQWANATFVPGGADIDGDGLTPDGFEVGIPLASDIDPTTAAALFDPTSGLSMTNDTGIQAWFGALLGNTTLQGLLGSTYTGLNATQFGLLYAWLGVTFKDGIAKGGLFDLLEPAGVAQGVMSDIGYLHWGSPAVTSGLSANDLDPTTGGWIEVWAYASRILSNSTFALDIGTTKNLMTGTYNLTDTVSVGTFMALGVGAAGGNATLLAQINGLFGTSLDASQVGVVLSYLSYVMETLVVPTFGGSSSDDLAFIHWGSPLITDGKSVHGDLNTTTSTLPGQPEFWSWAANITGIPYTFNLSNSKALLGSLNDSKLVGLVLLSVDAVNSTDVETSGVALATVNGALGSKLNKTDYFMLAGYLQYLFQKFVIEFTLLPIFALDGDLITDRTVNEWLFDYKDPLLQFLVDNGQTDSAVNSFFANHDNNTDPRISPSSTFKTGGDNIDNLGQYVNWEGLSTIPSRTSDPDNGVWNHDEVVRGTDATQFHPGVSEDEVLEAWVSQLMRSIDLVFSENIQIHGINLLRFVISDNVLAVNNDFDQTIEGVANMAAAVGAPLFVSKPHFLDASSTASSVGGLSADKAKHDLFVDVEPTTGAVMSAAKRLQISFQVGPGNLFTPGIAATDLLPVLWIDEGGEITKELADKFIDAVYRAQNIERVAPIGGAAVGIVLLLTSMFIALRARKP